jgi:DNA polymerase-3 subunit beta
MEIEVGQDRLAKALNIVSRVAANLKTALPVLNNVLIRADNNKLALTATNLELATVDYVGAKIIKDGTITVPAKLLAEFVSNLPRGEMVKMKVNGSKLVTTAGKYKSTVNGLAADEFPELPQIKEDKAVIFKVGIEDFRAAVSEVLITASNDTTRPALTGVYFNTFEGALFMAATDGYRLSQRKFIDKVSSDVFAIVPTAALQEVIRSIGEEMEEVEILFDETQVRFRLGEIEVTSKLIEGSFPDYRQLIPEKTDISVVLDKSELTRVVKLAALFAREVGGSITIEANEEKEMLMISSVANEFGENSSEIKGVVRGNGKITLNSRFVMDALNATEEATVDFGFSENMAPAVIQNEKNKDYIHIIMPLKS